MLAYLGMGNPSTLLQSRTGDLQPIQERGVVGGYYAPCMSDLDRNLACGSVVPLCVLPRFVAFLPFTSDFQAAPSVVWTIPERETEALSRLCWLSFSGSRTGSTWGFDHPF